MKLNKPVLDRNPNQIFGITSPIIWNSNKSGSEEYPIMYLRKPKSIPQAVFDDLIDRIQITFKGVSDEEEPTEISHKEK